MRDCLRKSECSMVEQKRHNLVTCYCAGSRKTDRWCLEVMTLIIAGMIENSAGYITLGELRDATF